MQCFSEWMKGSICHTWADPQGERGPHPDPGKSQVAIGFLRNTGMDLPQEGPICFLREVHMASCEIAVKYVDENLQCQDPP